MLVESLQFADLLRKLPFYKITIELQGELLETQKKNFPPNYKSCGADEVAKGTRCLVHLELASQCVVITLSVARTEDHE